jgi:hypothetical protein
MALGNASENHGLLHGCPEIHRSPRDAAHYCRHCGIQVRELEEAETVWVTDLGESIGEELGETVGEALEWTSET